MQPGGTFLLYSALRDNKISPTSSWCLAWLALHSPDRRGWDFLLKKLLFGFWFIKVNPHFISSVPEAVAPEHEAKLNTNWYSFKSAIAKPWTALIMHSNKHMFRRNGKQGVMVAKLTRLTQQLAKYMVYNQKDVLNIWSEHNYIYFHTD